MCSMYISPSKECYCTNELLLFDSKKTSDRDSSAGVPMVGVMEYEDVEGLRGLEASDKESEGLLHHHKKGKKKDTNDDDRSSEDKDDDRHHHKKGHHHHKDHRRDNDDNPELPYPPPSPLPPVPFPKHGKSNDANMEIGIKIDPKDLPKVRDIPTEKEIRKEIDPVLDEIRDAIDHIHKHVDSEIREIRNGNERNEPSSSED